MVWYIKSLKFKEKYENQMEKLRKMRRCSKVLLLDV